MASTTSLSSSLTAGLDKIHDSWAWFVVLGVALSVLGVVCIVGDVTTTKVTVLTLGWLLVFGAIVALVQSSAS